MQTFTTLTAVATLLATLSAAPVMAADIEAGKLKASANCAGCHGDDHSPGVFFSLQLAGRNADKLAIKTNKYRTGKLFNPLMNMGVAHVSDADLADITAYYQSLGHPYLSAPFIKIKGDDDVDTTKVAMAAPVTSAMPTYTAPITPTGKVTSSW